MMLVELDSKALVYTGRIDMNNPKKPEFVYPSTSLSFRFYGRKAEIVLTNKNAYWTNSVGAIVNNQQKKWDLSNQGETIITLLDEDQDKENEILLFKRMDSCHELVLEALYLSDNARLLPAKPRSNRRIEVYGDSVSAGEVSEAEAYAGKVDPDHDGGFSNSWFSYAWITARKLGAEIHNISQGGIPLLNGTGWVEPPIYLGMESVWDKVHYHPKFGKPTLWDFKKYTPHVVIIALGQNDSNPEDFMKRDFNGEKSVYWRKRYKAFILAIREKYPQAYIILGTTILNHDDSWDKSIELVCKDLGDTRIKQFLYLKNGRGTPGHIRASEAEEMAEELAGFINGLEDVWD